MSKECALSLRKGCGGRAAGPDVRIDEPLIRDVRRANVATHPCKAPAVTKSLYRFLP